MPASSTIIALDVGGRRIGVASANVIAKIASPLVTIENTPDVVEIIEKLLADQEAIVLVVGLPRNQQGLETEQTKIIESFVETLKSRIDLPIHFQDESVTSRQAEAELLARGKPYNKGDIDALAATYILEDFLREHPEVKI